MGISRCLSLSGRRSRYAIGLVLAGVCLTVASTAEGTATHHRVTVPFYNLHWQQFAAADQTGNVTADGPYLLLRDYQGTVETVTDTRFGTSYAVDGTPPVQTSDTCSSLVGGGRVLADCQPPNDPDNATLWEFILATRTWQQIPTAPGELGPAGAASPYDASGVGTTWAVVTSSLGYPGGGASFDQYIRLTTGALYQRDASENDVEDLNRSQSPFATLCKPLNSTNFIQWITPRTALLYVNENNENANTSGPLYVQSCGSHVRRTFTRYVSDSTVNDSLMVEVPGDNGLGISHARLGGYDGRTGKAFELPAPPTGAEGLALAGNKIYADLTTTTGPVEVATLPKALNTATSPELRDGALTQTLRWAP